MDFARANLPDLAILKISGFLGMSKPCWVRVPFDQSGLSVDELPSDLRSIPDFVYMKLGERTKGEQLHVMWDLLATSSPSSKLQTSPLFCALFGQWREQTLFQAADSASTKTVEIMLNLDINPDGFIDELYESALHRAAERGCAEIWNMLLAAGADPNRMNMHGLTPTDLWKRFTLWLASRNSDVHLAYPLLKDGDVNFYGPAGTSPLQEASKSQCLDLVIRLLQAQADPLKRNGFGPAALHYAIQQKNVDIARVLLEANSSPNMDALTSDVFHCCDSDDFDVPLVMAIQTQSSDFVKMLLEYAANANVCVLGGGQLPLEAAAQCDNTDMVKMLLDSGALVNLGYDMHSRNAHRTALEETVSHGNLKITSLLLEAKANPLLMSVDNESLKLSQKAMSMGRDDMARHFQVAEQAWTWKWMAKTLIEGKLGRGFWSRGFHDDYRSYVRFGVDVFSNDGHTHGGDDISDDFEEPVVIDAEEAAVISHAQWLTTVDRFLSLSHGPDSIKTTKNLVVLALTKHTQDIEAALLKSAPAVELTRKGFNVKPDWACGAKVFTEVFTSADAEECRLSFGQKIGLGPHHVVIKASDESAVLSTLRPSNGCRALATVKQHCGRAVVPESGCSEWFMCSVCSPSTWWYPEVSSSSYKGSFGCQCAASSQIVVTVKNTFIDAIEITDFDTEGLLSAGWAWSMPSECADSECDCETPRSARTV